MRSGKDQLAHAKERKKAPDYFIADKLKYTGMFDFLCQKAFTKWARSRVGKCIKNNRRPLHCITLVVEEKLSFGIVVILDQVGLCCFLVVGEWGYVCTYVREGEREGWLTIYQYSYVAGKRGWFFPFLPP